jgi:hypothetical protein
MSQAMPPERAFRVLRAQSDRVRVRQLASIALACVCLGLAVIGAADRYMPARSAREHAAELQASLPPAPALAAAAALWAPPAPARTPQPDPPPRAATDHASRANHDPPRLVRQRITYPRCTAQAAPNGCTRSRALEQHVWRALRAAAACYGSDEPRGSAQLRLELSRTAEIAFLPPDHGPSLNLSAVRRCVEPHLATGLGRFARVPRVLEAHFGLR